MNDRLRPRKKMAPSAEPAQYRRRQQASPVRPLGSAARRGKGDGTRTRPWVEAGKGSSPRRESRRKQGSRARQAERRSAAKARAWRMGPYERRRGVMPAEQRDPTEGTPRAKRGARDDKAHDHNAGASTADRPSGEV